MYQTCLELMSNWQYPNAFALNHGRYVVCGASIMPSSANATPPNFPLGYSHLPVEMLRPEITAVFSILQTQKPTVLAQGGT
jgi:hypothetical protein